VNHLLSALTGERRLADLRVPLGRLPLIEALKGAMPEGHNERARLVGRETGMSPLLPLFTLGVYAHELQFGARQFRAFQRAFGWPASEPKWPGAVASCGEAA
jgi:hypothetical protein